MRTKGLECINRNKGREKTNSKEYVVRTRNQGKCRFCASLIHCRKLLSRAVKRRSASNGFYSNYIDTYEKKRSTDRIGY